ncbi:disease resistance CC-NBS-LRR class family protein [Tanacetum coccineum]|uniref:Disease resistance CC-NBS-LRR class family protein n=1 Tax=Tanacetum coccineum TaxID=301880 RepID=A0ABQ5EGU6_9ASTR
MMRKIIKNSKGHSLRNHKVLEAKNITCVACSQRKLIIRPSPAKIGNGSLNFLERIQGDICGPIHPPYGPFRYYMVLIDASTRWSHVCLLSSRNMAFARLLAQLIRLRAHFLDFPIKTIRLDNAGEFTSQTFNDYCMSIGISVEHSVAHVHTQNGLAESLIKRIQMIARPMIMKAKLPVYAWGYAVLHVATLIRIRPMSHHTYSLLQLVFGQEPNISHLRIFGCVVYVLIAPPQRTKMRPQRRMEIYVGYDSPSIIRYGTEMKLTSMILLHMENDEDHEPKSVPECKNRNDWPKWKDAIEAELQSLEKREVFRPVVRTPEAPPMVVRTLDVEKDPFRPPDDDEEMLGPEARRLQQLYMKIMQHALLNLRTDTSKVIEQSIFYQNFFFTHDLQKSGDIIVQQIRSSDNLADLFTKALPTTTFKKLVHRIGIRRLKELK